jgi:hypothetical protein
MGDLIPFKLKNPKYEFEVDGGPLIPELVAMGVTGVMVYEKHALVQYEDGHEEVLNLPLPPPFDQLLSPQ